MERELSIYRYSASGDEKPYQLQVRLPEGSYVDSEFQDFSLPQEVFDFCAEKYPGEKVAVEIQGERTFPVDPNQP